MRKVYIMGLLVLNSLNGALLSYCLLLHNYLLLKVSTYRYINFFFVLTYFVNCVMSEYKLSLYDWWYLYTLFLRGREHGNENVCTYNNVNCSRGFFSPTESFHCERSREQKTHDVEGGSSPEVLLERNSSFKKANREKE